MIEDPLPPSDQPGGGDDNAPLARDAACIRCSYNLRGLRPSGNCPECGTPVEDSLRGFLLRHAAPEYVEQLRQGLSLILNSILLTVALLAAMILAMFAIPPTVGPRVVEGIIQLAMLVPSLMMLVGYWKYTAPDPGFVGSEDPRAARKVLRIVTIAGAAITALDAMMTFMGASSNISAPLVGGGPVAATALDFAALVVGIAGLVVALAQYFSGMKYTAWVASRVPDEWIIKRSNTYLWLIPVIFLFGACVFFIGPLIALVLYWNLLDRLRKRITAIQGGASATPPVAG